MLAKIPKNVIDGSKRPKISYWSKTRTRCPSCEREFDREEMLSGSGRTIAGELTDELHRLYEPSAKYGKIYPLIYAVGACPRCHIAFFWNDFPVITDKQSLDALKEDEERRITAVNTVFPHYQLKAERSLLDGAAMYYLALLSYEKVDLGYAPTVKRAVISLRLAWLSGHLHEELPGRNFDWIAKAFYRKALFFYAQTLENEMARTESLSVMANLGPDTDKNYGYGGLIYELGLLEFKYGQTEDMQQRLKKLDEYKRAIARGFGLGKSSKAKPGPLLEKSRELYTQISKVLADANDIGFEPSDDDE